MTIKGGNSKYYAGSTNVKIPRKTALMYTATGDLMEIPNDTYPW
jgi:hypothetical protein